MHLERIAKEAGVGSATLYRNFPTWEALIEAVHRNEVAHLCDAVPGLLAAHPPYEALRAWTRLFLDYVTAKLGMADTLRAITATGENPYGHSRDHRHQPGRHGCRPRGHRPNGRPLGAPSMARVFPRALSTLRRRRPIEGQRHDGGFPRVWAARRSARSSACPASTPDRMVRATRSSSAMSGLVSE